MAGYAELTLEQGANFTTTVTVNGSDGSPTNLTSYTAAAQLRKSYYSTTANSFTVTVSNAAFESPFDEFTYTKIIFSFFKYSFKRITINTNSLNIVINIEYFIFIET